LLLILAFAYAFWIKDSGDTTCLSIWDCLKTMYARLFEFDHSEINLTEIVFGILIVIFLLNIVIAIVGEAWTSAAEKSTKMFWMFRLEKIYQLRCAAEVRYTCNPNSTHGNIFSVLMKKIDRLESISYGDNVSWTKQPYHVLKTKDHYDHPRKYFCDDLSVKIIEAHSLQADMYWHQVELLKKREKIGLKDQEETQKKKEKTGSRSLVETQEGEDKTYFILLKWLGRCLCYAILVFVGIPLCGIIWPKKFRAGLLSMGNSQKMIESNTSSSLQNMNESDTNSKLKQQLAETSAKLDETVITNLTQQLAETSAKLDMSVITNLMQQLAETSAKLDQTVITNLTQQLEEKSAKINLMQQLAETSAELRIANHDIDILRQRR